MSWNQIMAFTTVLSLMVIGVLGVAVSYQPLFVPAAGAGALFLIGWFITVHYQYKYRESAHYGEFARILLRVYVFPVCALVVLAAWMISLARHHLILTAFR